MMIVQRPDLMCRMLFKQKFKNHTCSFFSNDRTPTRQDNLFDYDLVEEMDLLPQLWNITVNPSGYSGEYVEVEVPFFEPIKIYGYVIIKNKNNQLICAERFQSAPYNIGTGGTISVRPMFSLKM